MEFGFIPLLFFLLATEGLLVLLVATTYIIFVYRGGEWFLPTISNTWEDPPSTYISRFFGAYVATMLFLCVTGLYCVLKRLSVEHNAHKNMPKLIYKICVLGIFLFSWVPGICDTTDVSCRGYNTLHSTCATTFFVLVDIALVMAFIYFYRYSSTVEVLAISLLLTSSFASTLLNIPTTQTLAQDHLVPWIQENLGSNKILDKIIDNFTAVVEWTNVSILMLMLTFFLKKYKGYSIGIGQYEPISKGSISSYETLYSFNTVMWGTIAAVLFPLQLSATVYENYTQGYWNKTLGVPSIPQLQVHAPSSWLTHWTFMYGSICLTGVHMAIGLSNQPYLKTKKEMVVNLGLTLAAMGAFFGLSLEGICSPAEDKRVNTVGAVMFSGLYNAYMVLIVGYSWLTRKYNKNQAERSWLVIGSYFLVLCCTLSKTRFLMDQSGKKKHDGIDVHLTFNLLEWVDMECIFLFIILFIQIVQDRLSNIRLMIRYKPSSDIDA